MLSAIRAFAKSWVATVLIGLLIVSFGVWGIRDVFHGKISNAVVTAGSRQLTGPEFKRIFNSDLQRVEQQQQGQQISLQDAVAAGFDTRVLADAATHEAYAEYVSQLGLTAANALVLDAITKEPAFGIRGQFDRQTYLTVLRQNDLTPQTFEADARDEIAQSQLDAGLAAGLAAPKTYGALIAAYELETRDLSYFVLAPQSVPMPALPTDAQLQDFINQHAAQLKRPEMRQLTVVRFSAKALAPTMPVDPAALQKLYAFRKDTASTPEKRSLTEIPVKDAATAAKVAAGLRAGQDPTAVAKAIGTQPIVYADVVQGAIADAKIAAAAFAMKSGEVSAPIQGALGLGVIKLGDIQPAHTATLDEMRPQLEAQVRTDAAGQKVYDMVQKYQDAHGGGSNMADAAKAVGAAPQSLGPLTADGADVTGAPVAGVSPKLLQDAFKLPAGGESDMESESSGEYFAVRVEKVLPPAVPPLALIKPQLTRFYMIQQMNKLLTAKAAELSARIRKGETFDAVAASAGVKVGHAAGVTRAALSQSRTISQDMATQIFSAKKGEVISGPTGQVAIMVARIDASAPPAPAQAAAMTVQRGDALSGQLFQDVSLLLRDAAKAKIKPTTDPDLARQALGLSADSLPKSSPSKTGGPPAGSPAS